MANLRREEATAEETDEGREEGREGRRGKRTCVRERDGVEGGRDIGREGRERGRAGEKGEGERGASHLRSNSRAMSSSVLPSAVKLHLVAARPPMPLCMLPPPSVTPPILPIPLLRDMPLFLPLFPHSLQKEPSCNTQPSRPCRTTLDGQLASLAPFPPPYSPAPLSPHR